MHFEEIVDLISNHVFGLICHQDSGILMDVAGRKLMLCPRCSGLHSGFFFILLLIFIRNKRRFALRSLFAKVYGISTIALLFFEWLLAQKGIIHSSSASRYITGLLAGSGFCLLVLAYRNYTFNNHKNLNDLKLPILLAITLLMGMGLFRLNNWYILTISLFLMVLINFVFIMQTIISRLYSIYFQNQKTLLS